LSGSEDSQGAVQGSGGSSGQLSQYSRAEIVQICEDLERIQSLVAAGMLTRDEAFYFKDCMMQVGNIPQRGVRASGTKMLIDGMLVESPSTIPLTNPATGQVFAHVPDVTRQQTNNAVSAAKQAFQSWQKTSHFERQRVIEKIVEVTNANSEALCEALVKEQGKPLSVAQAEVGGCAFFLQGLTSQRVEDKVLIDNDAETVVQMHMPLGVVGGICAWNFPLLIAAWKVGEAIMTGNTIVIKSSPYTPLATNMWAELMAEHVPRGVVNVVSGGDDAGRWLVEHEDVAKISFTGSVETGKKIQAAAAPLLKRTTLELGGNDVALVLDDAKPEKVVPAILGNAMANSGQICIAVKRCYVPRNKYNTYIEAFRKAAAEHKVGDGFEEGVTMGPLNNKMQFERVCELIADAKRNGATVEAGGAPLDRPGYFIPPTILGNVSDGMRIVDEEQFGPVLPIIPYDSVEEAIAKANGTEFGLGGSVWGEDEHAAKAVAAQINSGTVWVNSHQTLSPDVPFGGIKHSGIGRQMGAGTIAAHTDIRIVRSPKGSAAAKGF